MARRKGVTKVVQPRSITFRVPKDVYDELDSAAVALNVSLTELLNKALIQALPGVLKEATEALWKRRAARADFEEAKRNAGETKENET